MFGSRFSSIILAALLASGCGSGFGSPELGKLSPIGPAPAPVADTQTLSIMNENDDGEVFGGYPPGDQLMFNGENNVGDTFIGNNGVTPLYGFYGFFRFQLSKAIPAGAVVSNAVLTMYGDGEYQWDDANDSLVITANDSADAAQLTVYEDTIGGSNGNLPVSTTVSWPASGPLVWVRPGLNSTPNLKAIVQELVDKYGGLAAGASIQIWIFGLPSIGDSEVRFADYGLPDHATSLVIDWEK